MMKAHHTLLSTLLLCFVLCVVSTKPYINTKLPLPQALPSNASYGQLAMQLMKPALISMNNLMSTLNDTSLPTDVKNLRSALIVVRNILDVFVFAYPNGNGKDIFLLAREDINDGYTWIGNFKDLNDSHVNYTFAEMVALRNVCLEWQEKYEAHAQKFNYNSYFVSPSATKLYIRNNDDLSPYFWGAEPGLMPALNRSGYQNIAFLMKTLTADAYNKYDMFCNLTQIYDPVTQLVFHGYRKLIRAINAVSTFADEIYMPNSTCVPGAIVKTTNLYTLIGKIEDQITAYNFYIQTNQPDKAQAEEVVINTMFTSLLAWMKTNRPDISLACLLHSLIPI